MLGFELSKVSVIAVKKLLERSTTSHQLLGIIFGIEPKVYCVKVIKCIFVTQISNNALARTATVRLPANSAKITTSKGALVRWRIDHKTLLDICLNVQVKPVQSVA